MQTLADIAGEGYEMSSAEHQLLFLQLDFELPISKRTASRVRHWLVFHTFLVRGH
jgi:hypothetical protein